MEKTVIDTNHRHNGVSHGVSKGLADDAPLIVPFAGAYAFVKRTIDIIAAGLLLLLLSPVLAVVAVLVKLTSRGPVLYKQVRLGLKGKPFRVWKFRSMVENAEAGLGAVWSTGPNDVRITGIGRMLRDTHIDEFPQLFNVLWGSMSLIGPRPERPEIIERLEEQIPPYRKRMLVRPGITGFAQVRLPPDTDVSSVRRKLAYDLFYIEHATLWMDLRILLLTGVEFFWSLGRASNSVFSLPSREEVEKFIPHLLNEEAARDTFTPNGVPVPHYVPAPVAAAEPRFAERTVAHG
jgi:lipopolysaccharide/colanic/teichoic acid biosynthesis glycosyltransferase